MKKYILLFLISCLSGAIHAQTMDGHHISDFGSYGEKKLKKAPKKVYISSFKVFYQVYISDEHKHNNHHEAPHEFEATLMGADTTDFQKITDELYAFFIDSLTSRGYELLPFDSVQNTKYFDGWVVHQGGELTHSHIEGYLLSRPSGYTHYEHQYHDHVSFMDELPLLSKELGDIIVMDVEFVFPFVHTNKSKTGYAGHHISDAHIQFNLTPVVGGHEARATAQTRIHAAYGNPSGLAAKSNLVYSLKHPVKIDGVIVNENLGPIEQDEKDPDYYSIIFNEGEKAKVTNHIVSDADAYRENSIAKAKEFARYGLHKLFYFKELE